MLEKDLNKTVQKMDSRAGLDILSKEDKSSLRNFAQKVHSMEIEDVGRLHNGFADSLTSEQKDIVAYELKLREYDLFKKRGINPKVDFLPEKLHPNPSYETDKVSRQARLEEAKNSEGMTEDLLERSREIIENAYIPVERSKFHDKDGGGINAMFNKIVAVDDNGNQIKVNNRAFQESYRKNYLKALSDVTGIDYTRIDDGFYDNFSPMNGPQDPNVTSFDRPNVEDSINMDDYVDDDDCDTEYY